MLLDYKKLTRPSSWKEEGVKREVVSVQLHLYMDEVYVAAVGMMMMEEEALPRAAAEAAAVERTVAEAALAVGEGASYLC